MKARIYMAVITIAALLTAPLSYAASKKIGIFETVYASDVSFEETTLTILPPRSRTRSTPTTENKA